MDTSDKHGDESGHAYLRNPIWWGGMITSMYICVFQCFLAMSNSFSGHWRSSQFCSIYICTSDFSDTSRSPECFDRVSSVTHKLRPLEY